MVRFVFLSVPEDHAVGKATDHYNRVDVDEVELGFVVGYVKDGPVVHYGGICCMPVTVPVGGINRNLRATGCIDRDNEAEISCCDYEAKPSSIPQINQIEGVIRAIHLLHLIIIKPPEDPKPLAKWVQVAEARTPTTFARFLDNVRLVHYRFLD